MADRKHPARNDEADDPPPSRGRGLDRGLNQSLRVLDNRYVDEDDIEREYDRGQSGSNGVRYHQSGAGYNGGSEYSNGNGNGNNIHHSDHYHYYHNDPNDPENSFNSSGYISTIDLEGHPSAYNPPDQDCESRSFYTKSAMDDDGSQGLDYGDGEYDYEYDDEDDDNNDDWGSRSRSRSRLSDSSHRYRHDDPRFRLFSLLDLHCPSTAYDGDAGHSGNDWEPIREWFRGLLPGDGGTPGGSTAAAGSENDRILRAAVLEGRGRSGQTVLHVACERSVPPDVLEAILSVAERAVAEDEDRARREQRRGSGSTEGGRSRSTNPLRRHPATCPTLESWLPLHYACNYPNDYAVVRRLVEAYPAAKTHADLKGRTPLHFAMREENMNRPQVVALLSSAAGIADDNGILPLHYACLYGATEDFLRILTDAYPQGVAARDRFDRVPLHYSLSNAGRPNAPAAVRLLLGLDPGLVNIPGIARTLSGSDAVRRYADQGSGGGRKKAHGGNRPSSEPAGAASDASAFSSASVEECLRRFLAAKPRPTADFFTALQSLPEALREKAVLMREVQELLNQKIGQRFPTALLLADLYLQVVVVVVYTMAVRDSIEGRFRGYGGDGDGDAAAPYVAPYVAPWTYLAGLYIGLVYFLVREIVQIIGLVSLKASWIWVYEPGTWLNVAYIFYIGVWTVFMTTGWCERDVFRTGAALSFALIWLKFLSYLRKILIDFSVFSGGVFHVLRRLLAFLMCLTIILIAFSRMFFALFYETEYCASVEVSGSGSGSQGFGSGDLSLSGNSSSSDFFALVDEEAFTRDLICEANDRVLPWCNSWDSFLAVYTMLLGEVDETVFDDNPTALALFVVFMLLVVILLANVLIAIVTDSYKVIRDKRAAIVFWTNRLDFIAQMDAIASIPWRSRFRRILGLRKEAGEEGVNGGAPGYGDQTLARTHRGRGSLGKDLWNDVLELFDHDSWTEDGPFSLDFILCAFLRAAALVLVPLWILAGALVVGLLWPPQIREKLFVSAVTLHSSETEKEETQRKTQIERVRREVGLLREDLLRESARHRTQIIQMKSAIAERKLETTNTLAAIKKNVVLALELFEMGQEE
ncbi:unnamed protein product [Pseudo-nitzschia multistriata]|uniref:Ion transport domain-containing protein n=1 Tax=Pseudo-nitzschia multistriata TaxID=183589 RepID=A0A448ZEE9_9STRA|nr:unnamed protein product [Pseudo-nitzschia multistriata]